MGTYATTTTLEIVMVGVDFSATGMATLGAKAIAQAEAECNKYLSKRYDLSTATFQTSTSIPPIVTMLAEQLAEGYMWRWMSRGGKESLSRGEKLIKGAQDNLLLIADYKSDLVNTAGSVVPDMENASYKVQCNTSDFQSTFDEDSELAWRVDPDKMDGIDRG